MAALSINSFKQFATNVATELSLTVVEIEIQPKLAKNLSKFNTLHLGLLKVAERLSKYSKL